MPESEIQVEVRDSLRDVACEDWNALCTDGNPFLRYEFLHTLDETDCLRDSSGWYPRYFLLWQNSGNQKELVGAVPAYVKTHSYGEFVFDWSWADAYQRHQLEYYPKLVSSIPFTPATGARLLVRSDQPFSDTVKVLALAVRQFTATQDYSSAHFLFVTEAESKVLSANALTEKDRCTDLAGLDTASDHLKRIDCQYHWHNDAYSSFDDFLARCSAKRRKTIRRERRHVSDAGLNLSRRTGDSLTEQEWRWVHQLYESTFDRKWGNPSLTRHFFEQVGKKMGSQVLIILVHDPTDETPEQPVACSIMFVGEHTLYGRFWGCRRQYHCLHFEACYYQGIEYCIDHGIDRFEPGAQGEHKITRGFVPTITYSAHYIRHPGFRDAIADFLNQEIPHVKQRCAGLSDLLPFRKDSVTLKAPNADTLSSR
ncbi:MAG: GNAT family N-acetyltransferase [Granulosicoccus sp.]|nr:GNAT family N-acetyltransferase [Granulosicoccus sp.]